MMNFMVTLDDINKVKEFVTVAKNYGDVTITSGRYVIDGKSILGIFSLDLSKPVLVQIYDNSAMMLEALKDKGILVDENVSVVEPKCTCN